MGKAGVALCNIHSVNFTSYAGAGGKAGVALGMFGPERTLRLSAALIL